MYPGRFALTRNHRQSTAVIVGAIVVIALLFLLVRQPIRSALGSSEDPAAIVEADAVVPGVPGGLGRAEPAADEPAQTPSLAGFSRAITVTTYPISTTEKPSPRRPSPTVAPTTSTTTASSSSSSSSTPTSTTTTTSSSTTTETSVEPTTTTVITLTIPTTTFETLPPITEDTRRPTTTDGAGQPTVTGPTPPQG